MPRGSPASAHDTRCGRWKSPTLTASGSPSARCRTSADVHGPLPAYSVAEASARYRPARNWTLALRVDNLFNRSYQSFAILGRNFFTGPGNTFDPAAATPEPFVSPGAPRAAWISLRYDS